MAPYLLGSGLTKGHPTRTYCIAHETLLSFGWELDGRGGEFEGECIFMAETLHCSPETITLLIGYNPLQNKKFKKKSTPILIALFWVTYFLSLCMPLRSHICLQCFWKHHDAH